MAVEILILLIFLNIFLVLEVLTQDNQEKEEIYIT